VPPRAHSKQAPLQAAELAYRAADAVDIAQLATGVRS
jgi:hypothetical protein